MVLCLAVYVPGLFTIAPIDRDEARFAQASRQMFEAAALPEDRLDPAFHDGGWAIPKVQDRPRLNKPPLIYWLQVASAWIFTGGDPLRDAIWMYRVPSVLSAIFAVLLTWRLGCSMMDPRAGWLGAALLAICPVVVFDAHQARADQLLLAMVVGMQWGLWEVWKRRRERETKRRSGGTLKWSVVFWIGIGLSVLAKGPIGPMIALLTVLGICLATRRWRWVWSLRPLIGVVVLLACVGPWVWMVGQHIGWSRYLDIVYDETIGRSIVAKEGHWGPPGYHTLLLAVLFWPGSMMAMQGVVRAWRRVFKPRDVQRAEEARRGVFATITGVGRSLRGAAVGRAGELFCLAWILPAWIVFEIVGTKLPHYTVPMYPGIAILSARALLPLSPQRAKATLSELDGFGLNAWGVIGTCFWLAILAAVCIRFATTGGGAVASIGTLLIAVGTTCLLAVLMRAWRHLRALELWQAMFAMGALAIALWVAFLTSFAPLVLPGATTRRMLAALDTAGVQDRPLGSEYHEDSMIYGTRGRVTRLNRDQLVAWLDGSPDRIAIVRGGVTSSGGVLDDSGDLAKGYRLLGTVKGSFVVDWQIVERDRSAGDAHPQGGQP